MKWSTATSTSVVTGVSEADCLRQAEADASEGRSRGYQPTGQVWGEEAGLRTLTITYRWERSAFAQPPVAPVARDSTGESRGKMAGVAWLVSAALLAALAVEQWNAAQLVDALRALGASLGVDTGYADVRPYAIVNALQAAVVAILGIKLIQYPTRGAANWSIALAVLSVLAGVVQPSALANVAFIGSIAAALVAGVLAYQAKPELI